MRLEWNPLSWTIALGMSQRPLVMNDSRPPPQNPNWIREAIESYRGRIFEMSKDQKGCRYILSFFHGNP